MSRWRPAALRKSCTDDGIFTVMASYQRNDRKRWGSPCPESEITDSCQLSEHEAGIAIPYPGRHHRFLGYKHRSYDREGMTDCRSCDLCPCTVLRAARVRHITARAQTRSAKGATKKWLGEIVIQSIRQRTATGYASISTHSGFRSPATTSAGTSPIFSVATLAMSV